MVVEPALANCDRPPIEMLANPEEVVAYVKGRGVVRVDSHRVPDQPGMRSRYDVSAIGCVKRLTDADEGPGACLTSRGDDGIPIAVEGRIGEVDVTVGENQGRGSRLEASGQRRPKPRSSFPILPRRRRRR